MQSVIETPVFSRRADALLDDAARAALVDLLASNPDAGKVVPGLGGVRKLRFAPEGRGKSGGFRTLYYYGSSEGPVYALLLYGKNEQADMTPDQRKVIRELVRQLK